MILSCTAPDIRSRTCLTYTVHPPWLVLSPPMELSDDAFFSSQALRFALRAETDMAAWNDYADEWVDGDRDVHACSSDTCSSFPEACHPARSVVSCTECLGLLSRCDIGLGFIKSTLQGMMDLRQENLDGFMAAYARHREETMAELVQEPLATSMDVSRTRRLAPNFSFLSYLLIRSSYLRSPLFSIHFRSSWSLSLPCFF
jgi:hypothetical protein